MVEQNSGKKVALITGAARRIGSAIAQDLAANGWSIAIHANSSRAQAEELAEAVRAAGGRAHTLYGDLRDNALLAPLIDEASAALGPVTLLVNNASLFQADEMGALAQPLFDDHMAVHVRAPCFLAEAMARALPRDMAGNVINIIDQRVLKPTPKFFSYTLSKMALWSATRTMAQALAPGIRVNAIGPGPTLPSPRQSEDDFRAQTHALLLQHGPTLAEFGRTVRFLVDTPSITGQFIALDGGQHLAWQTPDVTDINE